MKLQYIKTQEEYNTNEAVFKTNDNIFKVKVTIDVPKSLVSAISKKVKDVKGPDILDTFSQTEIAEELVKYITQKYLNVESIPASVLTGEEEQEQGIDINGDMNGDMNNQTMNTNPGEEFPSVQTIGNDMSTELPVVTIEERLNSKKK
jgi:hypothetical protein